MNWFVTIEKKKEDKALLKFIHICLKLVTHTFLKTNPRNIWWPCTPFYRKSIRQYQNIFMLHKLLFSHSNCRSSWSFSGNCQQKLMFPEVKIQNWNFVNWTETNLISQTYSVTQGNAKTALMTNHGDLYTGYFMVIDYISHDHSLELHNFPK